MADSSDNPDAETTFEWGDDMASLELYKAIQDTHQLIDDKEVSHNLSFRDLHMATLMHGLEETDQLTDVIFAARTKLGRDTDHIRPNRAEALRLLMRIGLEEVAPETIEVAVEANKKYLVDKMEEF